jgi:hypothetical protein
MRMHTFQLPPTPTPLPPGDARFVLPTDYTLWGGTDYAIQVWNWWGDWRTVFQVLIIIGLVVIGMFIAYHFVRQFTRRDAES